MLGKAHRLGSQATPPIGFTLVELLVVVSIASLLMAILSPSLTSARDQAKEVVCASRLKQWGLAFNCYAVENRGFWPHCDGLDRSPRHISDPDISQEDLADWHGWVDVLAPMIALKPWRDHPPHERPDHGTFFQCPWGRFVEGGRYGYRPERYGYFSYAMNSCLELDANAWAPPRSVGWPMPSFLDSAKVVAPQRVILLFDQLLDPRKGFDGRRVYRNAGKYCGSYPKSFSARHRRGRAGLGGNVLFCDGHAEWRKSVWKAHWNRDQEVPPRDDPNWYPYPVSGGIDR